MFSCPQAFCSRVFYNAETGFFEQVYGGEGGWGEVGGVTPSTSQSTLYLTDEAVGPVSVCVCHCVCVCEISYIGVNTLLSWTGCSEFKDFIHGFS